MSFWLFFFFVLFGHLGKVIPFCVLFCCCSFSNHHKNMINKFVCVSDVWFRSIDSRVHIWHKTKFNAPGFPLNNVLHSFTLYTRQGRKQTEHATYNSKLEVTQLRVKSVRYIFSVYIFLYFFDVLLSCEFVYFSVEGAITKKLGNTTSITHTLNKTESNGIGEACC